MRVGLWVKRIALSLLIFAVVIVLAVMGAAHSTWGRNKVRDVLQTQASKALDGTLTVQSLSGNFVDGVTLTGVRFAHRGEEAFSAESVEVRYSLLGWYNGVHDIAYVRLVKPVIHLSERDNNWNVAEWVKPSDKPDSGGSSTPVRLPHVELIDGRLITSANESVWRLPADMRELNGQLSLQVGGGKGTIIDIARLAFVTADAAFRATAAKGGLTFADDTHIDHLRVDSDGGSLTVDGRIGGKSPRSMALDAALDRFNGAKWRVWSPLLDTVDLTASGSAKLGGTIDALTIHSALKTTAGDLNGETLIASGPSELRITGTAHLQNFDAQHVTANPSWASSVTGNVQYSATSSGTPTEWTADVKVNGGPIRGFGVAADSIDGNLKYARSTLQFAANASMYGAQAHAAGTIQLGNALIVDVTGDHLQNLDPLKLPENWGVMRVSANLNAASFTAHSAPGHWNATATLEESILEGAALHPGSTVDVASGPNTVHIVADVNMNMFDARRVATAAGMSGFDDPLFTTNLNGHVKLAGDGRDWGSMDLTIDANLLESRAAGGAAIGPSTVAYTRRSHLNTAHVVGPIAHLNPANVGLSESLASDISGQADLTAVFRDDAPKVMDSLSARITLHAAKSTIAKLPVDGGEVVGEWRGGQFTADQLQLHNSGMTLTGRGRLAVQKGESNMSFELNASDIDAFEPLSGRAIHGAATGRGQLLGAFDQPNVVMTFDSPRITDPSLGTLDKMTGSMNLVFPEWDLDKMHGDIAMTSAVWSNEKAEQLATAVSASGTFSSRTHATTARIQATAKDTVVRATLSADWAGDVTADISSLDATRGNQTWRLDATSGKLNVTSTHVNASNVRLTNGQQLIVAEGRVALSAVEAGGDAGDQLSLRATAIDLASLQEFFGVAPDAKGQVSADATLVGRLSDPRGKITISAQSLSVRGYQMKSLGGSIEFANGAAVTDLTLKQPDDVALVVKGRVPLSGILPDGILDAAVPSPAWDVTAVSDAINLGILATVSPRVTELGGQAIIDVHVVGAAASPNLIGTVAVADGKFKLPDTGTAFSGVTADFGLGTDAITVRRFIAKDKRNHQLKLTGQLAVNERQLDAVDMKLDADRVLILDNGLGVIELSMLLQLNGDVKHPKLNGNVEVQTGRMEVDRILRALSGDPTAFVAETDLPKEGETPVDLAADAAAAKAAADAAAAKAAKAPQSKSIFDPAAYLANLAVDIRVLAPDNLILRGSRLRPGGKNTWSLGDLNVTVGGELQATRAPGQSVRLQGDITTVRGVYTFESRRFEIQRGGYIRFQGESPLDPTFNIRGVRTIQGVEARVDVRGRLSSPNLQLGSNVPLDDADILSMIIFNSPSNQLGDTQRADLVGAAATLAGGYVASPLTEKLSRALNLDLLEVETVSFGQNVAPRVRVGQQLTNRLFVQLTQQFGEQSLSELTAEFQLAKFLRLQASSAQGPGTRAQRSLVQRAERAGLDLLFFFNY